MKITNFFRYKEPLDAESIALEIYVLGDFSFKSFTAISSIESVQGETLINQAINNGKKIKNSQAQTQFLR